MSGGKGWFISNLPDLVVLHLWSGPSYKMATAIAIFTESGLWDGSENALKAARHCQ